MCTRPHSHMLISAMPQSISTDTHFAWLEYYKKCIRAKHHTCGEVMMCLYCETRYMGVLKSREYQLFICSLMCVVRCQLCMCMPTSIGNTWKCGRLLHVNVIVKALVTRAWVPDFRKARNQALEGCLDICNVGIIC